MLIRYGGFMGTMLRQAQHERDSSFTPHPPLSLKWRGQESGGAEAAQYSSTCSWTMILNMVW